MSTTPTANDLYREAQVLVKTGQPVFPCKFHGEDAKKPFGNVVPNGVLNATLDLTKIKSWWKRLGPAGLGIATGVIWDVLDVDVKAGSDGRRHLQGLAELGLLNGCKRVVKTPSGGFHLYFKAYPGSVTNKADQALGLDVRGKGGYVLAPPSYLIDSVSATGEVFTGPYVDLGTPTNSTDDPLLWNLILNNLAPVNTVSKKPIDLLPSERRSSIASLREWVANLSKGERNNGMFWAVCRAIESGIDPHELVEAATLTGLSEDEIQKSINSALKRAGVETADLLAESEALFPDQ